MHNSINLSSDENLIIIPDIHHKHDLAEKIIQIENPDKILFLGDYFDDFYDTAEDADATSKWLARSLLQKNRFHLIGNHDLSYMSENPNLRCTGYDQIKHDVIRNNSIPWDKMEIFCWVDDWLCTHAGMTNAFYMQQKTSSADSVQKVLSLSRHDLETMNDVHCTHAFFQVGFSRGGTKPVGGVLWCDYGEFVDIPGVCQIFGHSRGRSVRHKKTADSEHYCIDTQMNHYAMYGAHTMEIRCVGDL